MAASSYSSALVRFRFWVDGLHQTGYAFLGWAGLTLAAVVLLSLGLNNHGIINANESLYIESARELLRSGQVAVPTLNGLPYLEKPPLFVWLIASVTFVLGDMQLAARAVTSLTALVLVLTVARFSALLDIGSVGVAAGFILLTTLGLYVMSRVAMPDLLLTALFAIACLNFLLVLRTARLKYLRSCAALLGVAALVKGPLPIVLFGLIAAAYYGLSRPARAVMLKALRDPWSAFLLLAPLTLWLLAIEVSEPGAARYFIVDENVLRFLGQREPHDYYSGSVFYYLPRLFLFSFPWAGVLLFGWLAARGSGERVKQDMRRFLWLCVGIPFAFFTASSAKANYYIILCIPPMALLSADYLRDLIAQRRTFSLVMSIAVPVVVLTGLFAFWIWALAAGKASPMLQYRDGSGPATIATVVMVALAAIAILQAGGRRGAMLCLGGLIVPLALQLNHFLARAEPLVSARPMASYIQARFPGASVMLYQDYESFGGLPIYLNSMVPVIDSKSSDLFYGYRKYPRHANFRTEEQVLNQSGVVLVVVLNDREQAFASSKLGAKALPVTRIGRAALYRVPGGLPGRSESPM